MYRALFVISLMLVLSSIGPTAGEYVLFHEVEKIVEKPVIVRPDMSLGDAGQFESTAYTFGDGLDITFSKGMDVDAGVAAVDPTVVPLGSVVHIEGYGYALACDTGSDIKGNRIDVFFKSRDVAMNWGRRQVNVKIIKLPGGNL